ncbi:PREDICTED: pentatricopeptide repeat-containing protein At1g14470 [Lupinus angustifolius]|nr:PREDICTED: pentatricopeptide repeat-containing protein At1g14470 [Lupinus angustifolius]
MMSYLMNISRKIRNLHDLRQLHAQLVHHSLHHHNHWVVLLLNHCTRLVAASNYVSRIFESATHPNVHVFTCILKYYSQSQTQSEVVSVFKDMQYNDIKPDASLYPILIKCAGKACGMLFHSHVLKLGYVPDHYVRNAIMGMYAKYGPVHLARKLFDEMCDRNVADWNVIISGYWKWGSEEEANKIFHMMGKSQRNVITWTTMVTGYAKSRNLKTARMYFDNMPERSVVSWNAMLSGYAQSGEPQETIRLFNHMLNSGNEPDQTTWVIVISSCSSLADDDPSVVDSILRELEKVNFQSNYFVKTALLDLQAKCGNLEAARKIFDQLGVCKNSVTWNAMISAYARAGDFSVARDLFNKMPERNTVSWNSMISGYAQNGESLMAIKLFKEMISSSKDSKPNEVTMVSVFSACGHLGALDLGNWAVSTLNENHIKLSISGYNSLIFMYSRCGSIEDATIIFQEMETRDLVSYNTLISGLAAHGHGKEGIKLMSKMKEDGIEPDRITYIGVLTACSHAGLLEEGQKVFQSIEVPDVDHYACMIDMLGRAGKLEEAMKLIRSMPMEPHEGIYGSLLNAACIHKRVELGELAAAKLFKVEPHNSGNYVLLSNIYASAGRWKDVDKVWDTMRKQEVQKTTAWSWVEHKGEIHKFVVGDRSHERSDDIYKLLANVKVKLRREGYVVDKSCVRRDVEEEEKEEMVGIHSEKLAICFALLVSDIGSVIRVGKNLRICPDCHASIKMISKLERRKIIVRDNNRFHCFSDGLCSCKDYW